MKSVVIEHKTYPYNCYVITKWKGKCQQIERYERSIEIACKIANEWRQLKK